MEGREPTEVFVVEGDGEPIGLIQRYLVDDYPDWGQAVSAGAAAEGAVSVDYLIGLESLVGKGVGTEMIARFADDSFERYPDAPAIVVAVLQANQPSWRALEKAGFERCWGGIIDSGDASDEGPSYIYVRRRPSEPAR